MITWGEKVAFVGMNVEPMPLDITGIDACYRYKIKLRCGLGASSIGHGHTIDEAIRSAALGMPISWDSVEKKITEQQWERIAHT